MTEGDRAAVHIRACEDLRLGKTVLLGKQTYNAERLCREGLVQLKDVDVGQRKTGIAEQNNGIDTYLV